MSDITTLDLRGLRCPMPVLKTRQCLRKLAVGDELQVVTDDPLAGLDIPAFCNEKKQQLVEQVSEGEDVNRFTIRRSEGKL
ncbi:MAG: sulfurtransferase TusA family protein [Pseudomonadota bacterium]